ncbi:MAG TPA: hypothetical protein VGF03_08300, partial [Bryobacteraceae bacterium]
MAILKHVVSWILVALGLCLGVLGVRTLEVMEVFGSNSSPDLPRIIGCAMLAFLVLVASVIAVGNRRRAGLLFLIAAPIIGVCAAWPDRWGQRYDASFAEIAAPFAGVLLFSIIPGLFWYFSSRAGWPPLIPSRSIPGSRIHVRALVCSFLFGASVIMGLTSTFLGPHQWVDIPNRGYCRFTYSTPSAPRLSDSVIFTAKVVSVGNHKIGYDPQHSDWCVARVEQRYALPWWVPSFVVLRGYYFKRGEKGEYFVDGRRSQGLLTRISHQVFASQMSCSASSVFELVRDRTRSSSPRGLPVKRQEGLALA